MEAQVWAQVVVAAERQEKANNPSGHLHWGTTQDTIMPCLEKKKDEVNVTKVQNCKKSFLNNTESAPLINIPDEEVRNKFGHLSLIHPMRRIKQSAHWTINLIQLMKWFKSIRQQGEETLKRRNEKTKRGKEKQKTDRGTKETFYKSWEAKIKNKAVREIAAYYLKMPAVSSTLNQRC